MSTVAIVFTTLWLLSLANGYYMGGYIHLLAAVVVLCGVATLVRMRIRTRKP